MLAASVRGSVSTEAEFEEEGRLAERAAEAGFELPEARGRARREDEPSTGDVEGLGIAQDTRGDSGGEA